MTEFTIDKKAIDKYIKDNKLNVVQAREYINNGQGIMTYYEIIDCFIYGGQIHYKYEDRKGVFADKENALNELKKHKNCRLIAFNTYRPDFMRVVK